MKKLNAAAAQIAAQVAARTAAGARATAFAAQVNDPAWARLGVTTHRG